MSTSTTCRRCPGGCGRSRGSTLATISPAGPASRFGTGCDAYLADHDAALPDGRITALLQARVLGYVFNPISVFWCHDRDGVLRQVIVEVHNTYGQRHAYLLPPANRPVLVTKKFYVSPFNPVSGHYQVLAPRPDRQVDVVVSLHGDGQPAFVATLRGTRRPATLRHVVRMQILSPLAPLMVALRIRIQGIALWLRRVPVVPRMKTTSESRSADNRFGTLASGRQGALRTVLPRRRRSSPTGCCAASPPGCRCGSPIPTAR